MEEAVRKAFLFGLGVVALSKEKAEAFVKDLKENKNVTPEEGKKLVNEMMKKSNDFMARVRKDIRKQVRKAVSEMGVATKEDLEKMKKELCK
jgi:polyhydroxyalkanoate synthesis regulator phasin